LIWIDLALGTAAAVETEELRTEEGNQEFRDWDHRSRGRSPSTEQHQDRAFQLMAGKTNPFTAKFSFHVRVHFLLERSPSLHDVSGGPGCGSVLFSSPRREWWARVPIRAIFRIHIGPVLELVLLWKHYLQQGYSTSSVCKEKPVWDLWAGVHEMDDIRASHM
jgi:hypothetical protein